MKNFVFLVLVAIIVATSVSLGVSAVVMKGKSAGIAGVTNFDQVDTTDGYTVDSITVIDGDGNVDVSGETVVEGFTQGGGVTATSSSATATTLSEADLLASNVISLTSNTGNFTYTLPATSTLTTLIPTAGNFREWIFENATTTAATTLTIAAGTGIDLIAVTANDDVIDGTEYSRLTCVRMADTDVTCIISELLAAD